MRQMTITDQPMQVKISSTPNLTGGLGKALSLSLFYNNPGPGFDTEAALKAAIEATVAADWAAALSVEYLAPTILVRDMRSYANAAVEFLPAVNGAWAGTVAGDMLPPQAAVLMEKQTGFRGKNNRGSIFIPGVSEANTNDAVLTAGAIVLYQALAVDLALPVVTAGGQTFFPMLLSASASDQTMGVTGLWMQEITAFRLMKTITQIKRRKSRNQAA